MIEYLVLRELVPDWMIRFAIRTKLRKKLKQVRSSKPEKRKQRFSGWIEQMKHGPISLKPQTGKPHPELPATFFIYLLGRNLNFSSGYWPNFGITLNESEDAMLELTAQRAQITDGHKILDLGCGWGPLTLWVARKFPNCQVTAVTDSQVQQTYIEFQAQKFGCQNVKVIHSEIDSLQLDEKFDRVVSVEFFERTRNFRALLEKIAGFLKPDGKLFTQMAAHKDVSYPFEPENPNDWLVNFFLSGNLMPSVDILDHFQERFRVEERWEVPGTHYQKTCRAWFEMYDIGRRNIKVIFTETGGYQNVRKWWMYWRVYLMWREELFGFRQGKEWMISHTLLEKK